MIRRMLVAAVAVLALAGCSGGPDAPENETVASDTAALEGGATAIVRGSVGSTDADGDYTVAEFTVGQVAKGDVGSGETIEVGYWPSVSPGLREGGEYVLLLAPADDDRWHLVNGTQGYYSVASGVPLAAFDNPVELSPETRTKLDLG